MSGDVQPRKRKEKRRKKDSEEIPTSYTSDEQLHVHKDASTGGNICAKILFFLLSFVLVVMIGLVLFEYRGVADDETLVPVSKWAATFEGWLEAPVKHDEHADITESGEQEHGESGEHESAEGEEHASEEAGSKEEDEEEDEDEEKGSEEVETKSVEEEDEEEDEDEEADKSEDEKSEEVDENEIDDQDEDEQEEEEEEESEEDVYGHGKSEEDLEAEKEDADDDVEEEEEEEEEDVEAGREELDDDDDDEERETSAYQRDSNEIDDLNEIPGIIESDEDEEGDNLGLLPKIPGVDVKKIKAASEEEADVPRQKREKEVGAELKSSKMSQDKAVEEEEEEEGEDEPEPSGVPKARKLQKGEDDDDSGSEKEIPVTKSKIPKNMGGQNAQVYSKADITNKDDWHIIQDLDRADDDADEDLNF